MKKILFYILLTCTIFAEKEATITAFTKSKSFYTEQAFFLDIIVDKDTQADIQHIGEITGCSVTFMEKGYTKTGVVNRYQITPHQPGSLAIPPVNALSRSKTITSKPLQLTVKQPKQRDDIFIKIEVPDTHYFVGQAFPLKVTWFSKLPFYAYRAVDCRAPFFNDPDVDSFIPFSAPKTGQSQTIGLPISRKRIIGKRGKTKLNNELYEFISFERTIRINRSGEFTFEPMTMITSFIPSRVQKSGGRRWAPTYPSFFNNEFFDDVDSDEHFEKYLIKSNPVTLHISELPLEGQPENFSGIIGPFKMTADAAPKVLHAGDPLTLNIKMTDHPFIETLEVDPLQNNRSVSAYFSINSVQALPELTEKSLTFSKSIRPLSTDTRSIPSLKVSYFNPQTKRYEEAVTEPIALTVKEAKIVTAFDAELHDGNKLKNTLKENPEGIRHNYSTLDQSVQAWAGPKTMLKLAILFPIVLFILFLIFTRKHRFDLHNPELAIIRKAYKNFKKRDSQTVESLEKAVRHYFAEKLSLPANAHNFNELLQQLAIPLDDMEQMTLQALYQGSTEKRFNPGYTELTQPNIKKVKKLIKSLNRRIDNV